MTKQHTTDFVNDPRAKSPIDDPQHWHYRAEEMRTIADTLRHDKCCGQILRLADDYEKLATRATERLIARAELQRQR